MAILLGPWSALIAISIALTIQALLFGEGGVTALGANCFNMAFVMPMTGFLVYSLRSAKGRRSPPNGDGSLRQLPDTWV